MRGKKEVGIEEGRGINDKSRGGGKERRTSGRCFFQLIFQNNGFSVDTIHCFTRYADADKH